MLKPEEIPQYTGDLFQLGLAPGSLRADAGNVRDTGADVDAQFQGLSAFYKAPEAEQLFATTKQVKDRAESFAAGLETVASALASYGDEIRPLVTRLAQLKAEAVEFVGSVREDGDWEDDGDKVSEHNRIRDDITTAVAAFWAAERTCHNRITAVWGGTQVVAGDGTDREDQYGYDAKDLKRAKVPWGDAVEEKHHWWEIGHWGKSFLEGVFVDGVWGTVQGLGTLVGFGGWEAMGQAWKGLAQLMTAGSVIGMPVLGQLLFAVPGDKLPSWLRDWRRDSLRTAKEAGKAMLAWDEWGKNPARAGGAVVFNVVTTVFTGGSGAAASGAGKAGALARALSVAGRVGEVIDPMTYIAKTAGAGLSKVGDLTVALRGVGSVEIPHLPSDALTVPHGTVQLPDGALRLPDGAAVPHGAVQLPDGTVKVAEGHGPVLPEGTVKLPTEPGAPARYYDPQGNLLDEHGNVLQRTDDVRQEGTNHTTADTETSHAPAPEREPVTAGAAAHSAEARPGVRLDSGQGDVRLRADEAHPEITPTRESASADAVPRSVDRHPHPRPGGGSGGVPMGSLERLDDVFHDRPEGSPQVGNSHSGYSSGGHHGDGGGHSEGGSHSDQASVGGSHGDGTFVNGGGHGSPTGSGRSGGPDGESHHAAAEYEAAREKPADQRTPADRAAITREHVRLANEDAVWRAEHYDKWGPGKRNYSRELVDGQLLPKLVNKPDGSWMAADELPYANPENYHAESLQRDRDTVAPHELPSLDNASAARHAGNQLTSAEKAYVSDPNPETMQALIDAQHHFDQTVGEGVSNNSKLGEDLGEEAARRHMLLQPEFGGAHEITDLPDTANGSKRFDQLWRDKDGNLVIVEAKGPHGRLDWRQGNGSARGTMVKQGTIEYVRTIIADMEDRGHLIPKDRKYAREIEAAIRNKTLRYVLVQVTENTGQYAGATLRYFKIF